MLARELAQGGNGPAASGGCALVQRRKLGVGLEGKLAAVWGCVCCVSGTVRRPRPPVHKSWQVLGGRGSTEPGGGSHPLGGGRLSSAAHFRGADENWSTLAAAPSAALPPSASSDEEVSSSSPRMAASASASVLLPTSTLRTATGGGGQCIEQEEMKRAGRQRPRGCSSGRHSSHRGP